MPMITTLPSHNGILCHEMFFWNSVAAIMLTIFVFAGLILFFIIGNVVFICGAVSVSLIKNGLRNLFPVLKKLLSPIIKPVGITEQITCNEKD